MKTVTIISPPFLITASILSETNAFQYPIQYTRNRLIYNGYASDRCHHSSTSQSHLRTSSSLSPQEFHEQTNGASSVSVEPHELASASSSLDVESQHEVIIMDESNDIIQVRAEEVTDNTKHSEISKEKAKKEKVAVNIAQVTISVIMMVSAFTALIFASGPGAWRYFLCGGICAAFSHAITTPVDVIKVREG